MKNVTEMVWPMVNYTDEINKQLKQMFVGYHWLTFTHSQIEHHLTKTCNWLVVDSDRRKTVLSKLVSTGIKQLIQRGEVQKVRSSLTVEPQWKSVVGTKESGYTSLTSAESVAHTSEALNAIQRRGIGARELFKLNHS
jgi:hypothetical protein